MASTSNLQDINTNDEISSVPPSQQHAVQPTKLRRLKDRMWARETLEDLTNAEFACSLGGATDDKVVDESKKKKKQPAVDFENLLSKLDSRVQEMCVTGRNSAKDEEIDDEFCSVVDDSDDSEIVCYTLLKGKGMGSVVYTDNQRESLLGRLVATRQKLISVSKEKDGTAIQTDAEIDEINIIRTQLQKKDSDLAESAEEKKSSVGVGIPDLYVRDDGTVDWDGALQDRAAIRTFGTAVWSRINGRDPETVDGDSVDDIAEDHTDNKKVTAKIIETESIRELKSKWDEAKSELKVMEIDHVALLQSGIRTGAAVANIKLASLNSELRTKIRDSTVALDLKQDEVSFQMLVYELERIFTYLEVEVGNTAAKGKIPLQDRLAVAEFGLLESQMNSLQRELDVGEPIESDVLSVISDQVIEFKRKLGIDYYVEGLTFDYEAILRYVKDLREQLNTALAFGIKGCQLLWNDILFCFTLFSRALQGYTLKPREVTTLRRTFKDVITFIPFVIILIIPLSPVGHVLIFGAIQRFFPDFFPSSFTDARQNLLQLYESTEFSQVTIDENLKEKIARISEAFSYAIIDFFKNVFSREDNEKLQSTVDSDESAQ